MSIALELVCYSTGIIGENLFGCVFKCVVQFVIFYMKFVFVDLLKDFRVPQKMMQNHMQNCSNFVVSDLRQQCSPHIAENFSNLASSIQRGIFHKRFDGAMEASLLSPA